MPRVERAGTNGGARPHEPDDGHGRSRKVRRLASAASNRRDAEGWRRAGAAWGTIGTHRRRLDRELDRLPDLKPTDVEGSHLRATIAVTARDKLLVFLTRRDVEATNNESERALRPSVIFRRVTNGFRSEWGAKVYADLCSIVATGRL